LVWKTGQIVSGIIGYRGIVYSPQLSIFVATGSNSSTVNALSTCGPIASPIYSMPSASDFRLYFTKITKNILIK
jgi:hypothetical protein